MKFLLWIVNQNILFVANLEIATLGSFLFPYDSSIDHHCFFFNLSSCRSNSLLLDWHNFLSDFRLRHFNGVFVEKIALVHCVLDQILEPFHEDYFNLEHCSQFNLHKEFIHVYFLKSCCGWNDDFRFQTVEILELVVLSESVLILLMNACIKVTLNWKETLFVTEDVIACLLLGSDLLVDGFGRVN